MTSLTKSTTQQETTVTVEYIPAVSPPSPEAQGQHKDWISSVDGSHSKIGTSIGWRITLTTHLALLLHPNPSTDLQFVVSGSYDGLARVWTTSGKCKAELSGHTNSVTAVAVLPSSTDTLMVLTASKDCTARLWEVTTAGTAVARTTAVFRGHQVIRLTSCSCREFAQFWCITWRASEYSGPSILDQPCVVGCCTCSPAFRVTALCVDGLGWVRTRWNALQLPHTDLRYAQAGGMAPSVSGPGGLSASLTHHPHAQLYCATGMEVFLPASHRTLSKTLMLPCGAFQTNTRLLCCLAVPSKPTLVSSYLTTCAWWGAQRGRRW
eukprot:7726773-Pyramimonas_sp.AAC.1